jgi:hypothetical protein
MVRESVGAAFRQWLIVSVTVVPVLVVQVIVPWNLYALNVPAGTVTVSMPT